MQRRGQGASGRGFSLNRGVTDKMAFEQRPVGGEDGRVGCRGGRSGQREQQVQRPRGGRVCEAQGGRAAAFETRPVRTRTYKESLVGHREGRGFPPSEAWC